MQFLFWCIFNVIKIDYIFILIGGRGGSGLSVRQENNSTSLEIKKLFFVVVAFTRKNLKKRKPRFVLTLYVTVLNVAAMRALAEN